MRFDPLQRSAAITALALASQLAVGSAQQAPTKPTEPTPTFRTGVDIVTLDVSVVDGDRQPVHGLTEQDFTITESGKRIPIVAFKAIDLPDRYTYPAAWMREVPSDVVTNSFDADRVVVILMDDFNTPFDPADIATARKVGNGIIDQLGPADMAAVVYTFDTAKIQNFTTDRAKLRAAVDRFTSSHFSNMQTPLGGPNVATMACAHNECVTGALRAVSQALHDAWPGRRKAIALVSPEGNFSIGNQNIEQTEGLANNSQNWDSMPDLQKTFRILQESNVRVYQYDPRGLMESLGVSTAANTTSSIGMFADNAGGRIFTNSNAPETHVQEMFVENSSYYMLGFLAPTDVKADGKFRPVQIRVSKPDLHVLGRGGYFAPVVEKPAPPPKKTTPILDKAMAGVLPTGTIPMSLTVVPFATGAQPGAAVAIVAGVDRKTALTKETVEIAARAYDESSAERKSKGVARAKLELIRRGTSDGLIHYDVATRLDLAPGRYEVRLALDNPSVSMTGSVFTSVTVPDFTKVPLSLSGIVLGRLPPPRQTGKDPLSGLLPFMPTTMRTFVKSDRVGVLVRLYQGGKDTPATISVRSRLIDQRDQAIFDRTDALSPDVFLSTARTAEHRLELPISQLEPGEYLLSIEAELGKSKDSKRIRIKIE